MESQATTSFCKLSQNYRIMKLLFSEASQDYKNYIFPYVIWGIPEAHDSIANMFSHGFLPSGAALEKFYLCRNLRVDLKTFKLSSENRRIIRKCENISYQLIRRDQWDYTEEKRAFFKRYADSKFGKDTMSFERLDNLFNGKLVTDLLVFQDQETGSEVGTVALFTQPSRMSFFYFSFYDLEYVKKNLGMYMMTRAVQLFQKLEYNYIYLGTVYSKESLYKTNFSSTEFFNGLEWSWDMKQLKFLIDRSSKQSDKHLLESENFINLYYPDGYGAIAEKSHYQV